MLDNKNKDGLLSRLSRLSEKKPNPLKTKNIFFVKFQVLGAIVLFQKKRIYKKLYSNQKKDRKRKQKSCSKKGFFV